VTDVCASSSPVAYGRSQTPSGNRETARSALGTVSFGPLAEAEGAVPASTAAAVATASIARRKTTTATP
jgi:hypothetical protein